MAAQRHRAALPVLFAVVVVDLIGFGIVMPILPFYAETFGASASVLGLILSSYAAAQLVFAPLWGRLSDRVGRRRVMLGTVAGTAVALLLLGLADSLVAILAARLLAGAFAANVSVASAYLADVTEADERTRWMGVLGASFGVGFVLGPAIGGLLAPYGYSVPMFAAAGMAAVNSVFAAVALREPAQHGGGGTSPPMGRLGLLRDVGVRRLCVANLAFILAVTQLETVFAYFMMRRFDYDARSVAFILVGMALVMGGIQGGGMKALAARYPERSLVIAGALLLAGAFALMPQAPVVGWLLVPLGVAAVGRAILQPSLMSLVSLAAAPDQRGAVMGAFQSSASLARVAGPLAAGWLFDRALPAPFWLACVLLLVVAGLGRGLPAAPERARPASGPGQ